MNLDSSIRTIRSDAERLATAAENGPPDAPVASCPGWDLRQLVVHTGMVHRWAAFALEHDRSPEREENPTPDDDEPLGDWIRAGAAHLTDVLAATDPDADTWHPWPAEQKAWIWSRRMMHETALHRWDAEVAVNGSSSLDPELASDGIDEYFELTVPRILLRENVAPPEVSLHVHCTDVDGEWLAWSEAGEYRLIAEHRKGDAALRGRAEDLLLVLMGRGADIELDVVGDRAAADAWLSLPGM